MWRGNDFQMIRIFFSRYCSSDMRSSLGAKSNIVCFKFKHHPEYLKPGMRVIFREAGCKGIGTITKVSDFKTLTNHQIDIKESDYSTNSSDEEGETN